MTNYLIVAINHGDADAGELLSQGCKSRFKERISPLVTDRSLLLMEGFYRKELLRPTHSRHQAAKRHFGTALESVNPTFAGFDPRDQHDELLADRVAQRIDSWEMFCKRNFLTDWSISPANPEEAEVLIRNSPELPELLREPTREEIDLAKWVSASNRRFDREYIQAMRKYGSHYDTCVVVTGSVHAISIALKTGNPITFLCDNDPGDARDIYFAYLADYVWPSILIEGRTAT